MNKTFFNKNNTHINENTTVYAYIEQQNAKQKQPF